MVVVIGGGTGIGLWLHHRSTVKQANSASTSSAAAAKAAKIKNALSLDYSSQGLTTFPKEILTATKTTSLSLTNNQLGGALPAEIKQLTQLENLDVSNNKMTGIPAEIGQLSNLKILNYANNQITGLPLELGNLTGLQVLDLSGNPNLSQHDLSLVKAKLPNTNISQ